MSIRLLLIDALNLIRRVYAAQPGDDGPERARSGLRSSVQSLRRALQEVDPTHAVAVFEGREPGWRHELHDGYKEGHAPMPEALERALPEFEEAFLEEGVRSFRQPRMEADDVIATMAAKVAEASGEATILSTDKGYLQLLRDGITVRDHFRGRDLDAAYVHDKFGIGPERLVDLLALCGDSTNGVPGVHGVGPKRANALLEEHGSLEAILEAAPEIPGKLGERLADETDAARLSRRLVRLKTDLELGINLRDLRWVPRS